MHILTPLAEMMLPENVSDRRDARTFARSMLLAGDPRSPQAEALVTTIINHVIVPFRGRKVQVRPTMQRRYREALGPFLADLLHAMAADSDDAGRLFRSDPGHHSDLMPVGHSLIVAV